MDNSQTTLYGFGITFVVLIIIGLIVGVILFFSSIRIIVINFFKYIWNFFIYIFYNINEIINNTFRNDVIMDDNCAIIPNTGESSVNIPSAYLAHISFFLGFLFTNAYTVYNLENTSNSIEKSNRKARTSMIMAIIIVFYLIIIVGRYRVTNCESPFGILFTTGIFSILGYLFYLLAEKCGARGSDILGITSSIVPEEAKAPLLCANFT
jgi:hypothetical protein